MIWYGGQGHSIFCRAKTNARRHSLAGLTARVDDSDGRVRVIVEGPRTTIVESHRIVSSLRTGYMVPSDTDTAARKFAVAFNLASRVV
jgi:hypothetical protein